MPGASHRFGPFVLDLPRELLLRDGKPVPLRPKAFALLRYMADNPGRVVTKDELHDAIWPDVVVTDDSLTRLASDVRAALQEHGDGMLRTVPRRGYVFEAPVEAAAGQAAVEAPTAPAAPRRHRRAWAAGLALVAAGAAATTGWLLRPQPVIEPPQLSLSIPPLQVDGAEADAASRRAAESLATDLAAMLPRWPGVQLARPATGARMRFEGSFARQGSAWRVRSRLVDVATGATTWTDDVQVPAGETGARHLLLRLANGVAMELLRAAAARQETADAALLGPEDLAIRCEVRSWIASGEGRQPAYGWCEEALAKDPDNLRATVRLADYLAARSVRGQSPDKAADIRRSGELLERALVRDSRSAGVHCALAQWHAARDFPGSASASAERCLALHPLDTWARRTVAQTAFYEARAERVLASTEDLQALRRDDPNVSTMQLFRGFALMMLRRDDEALATLREAAAASPGSPNIVIGLAVQLALTGHVAEARATMQRYLSLPRTRVKSIDTWLGIPDPQNEAFVAFGKRFVQGLRLAGMPES